jgi:hypothetical protein
MRPVSAPLLALLLALLLFHSAHAFDNTPDFPYQATVGSDNVLVRSGPGRGYYPTGRLAAGDRVTVHRHDPGGWFMVSPPRGSFSWIATEGVQVSGSTGTVTATSLPVRVGSRFDETDRDVISRRLSRGETVVIIGRGQDAAGNRFLKIAPPRLEYRWVSGGVLAPIRNPATEKPILATGDSTLKKTAAEGPRSVADPAPASARPEVAFETTPIDRRPYDRLKALDASFGRIAGGPPAGWSFKQLEADYRTLMATTSIPGFRTLIRRRLAAVTRYRNHQQAVREIQHLANSTNRRDTAIRQAGHQVTRPATPAAQPRPQPVPQFSGAGIVRPIATGHPSLPSYVLVAPDGRLLAFLRPGHGINLAAWVNRSVGLTGQRGFHQDLQADLLQIQSIRPVRLRR